MILFVTFPLVGFVLGAQYQYTVDLYYRQLADQYPATITRHPTPTPNQINQTINWKTYRNERYTFELKYPQDQSGFLPTSPITRQTGIYLEKLGDGLAKAKFRGEISAQLSLLSRGLEPDIKPEAIYINIFSFNSYRSNALNSEFSYNAESNKWWLDSGNGKQEFKLRVIQKNGWIGYQLPFNETDYLVVAIPHKDKGIMVEIAFHLPGTPLSTDQILSTFKFD